MHSDVVGPLPVTDDGMRYTVTFQDQFSRLTHVTGLPEKHKAAEAFELYKEDRLVRKYFPKGVERLHTDGGGEYERVSAVDASKTAPNTPQHNPFSERINRTLLDPIRVLLEQSGLSAKYWQYALNHIAYIKNRIPHSALGCTPYEKLTGEKPKLHHLRTFGCSTFIYKNNPESKVHAWATPGILLGCKDHSVYIVERLSDGKIEN